ncbi:ABC transporter substrate-binding protein [Microlunatus elymi]|uniref:ABC transporter substrate-binding protein n=1 Tax=Microlunatus elymi TaxID=2596828 RepID=A0A516Q2N6_9ACTN|nr:ABC transporter substrate-binding protein [Microlunatus elymi]QDP97689.1 ABC transporter substrate-binding protein [Microlunatus elymi]
MNFGTRAGLLRSAAVVVAMIMGLAAVAGCQSSAGESGQPATTGAAQSSAFPVTIKHQFGETVIKSQPKRVLTVGFNEQDFALAFGVEPVGVRGFLGYDAPNRPWAPESVRGKKIPTVGSQEINFEKVAELHPDLILGINSYVDKAAYAKLSAIAPTIAQSGDVAPGATTWQDQTLTTGRALGQDAKARQLVGATEQAFAKARKEHPEFAGKTAAFALGLTRKGSYSLGADDYRTGWLTDLGFTVPETGGEVSFEKLDVLNKDVLVAEGVDPAVMQKKLIKELPPVKEGRFVDLGAFDDDFAGALGFNSPLSLPYLLDIAVRRLAAATDGDPSTRPEPYPN